MHCPNRLIVWEDLIRKAALSGRNVRRPSGVTLPAGLLEVVEAIDATDARHCRKRVPLLSEAEGRLYLKCATALHKRCVTCRKLAGLAHVARRAMQSKLATRGDPSFLWVV